MSNELSCPYEIRDVATLGYEVATLIGTNIAMEYWQSLFSPPKTRQIEETNMHQDNI